MIFDTWGGNLTTAAYEEFSLAYVRRVIAGLVRENEGRRVPVILFSKGGGEWLEVMASAGCDALGVDWSTDLARARRRVGVRVSLQGNLDPAVLLASPEVARVEARRVLDAYGGEAGHVFNLGHGITPQASIDTVVAVVDEVRTYSERLRSAAAQST